MTPNAQVLPFSALMNVRHLETYLNGLYRWRTLYRLAKDGKIPSHKINGKLFFLKEEIDRWLCGTPASAPDAPAPTFISRFQSARARARSLITEDTHSTPDPMKGAG